MEVLSEATKTEYLSSKTAGNGIPRFSCFWLFYLLISIMVVGGILAIGLCLPLFVLGRVWRPAYQLASWILASGIKLLLDLQIWLKLDFDSTHQLHTGLSVSNHRSNLDVFILMSRIRGLRITAKRSLFRIPFLGWMMWACRQIPMTGAVESYLSAMKTCEEALKNGERVHIFPEMRRCDLGEPKLDVFHIAPFRAAFRANALVLPLAILNSDYVWPKGSAALSFRQPLKIVSFAPVRPQDFSSPEALRDYTHQLIQNCLEAERS